MSHVFLLAAAGLLYRSRYDSCIIAADFSLSQQFLAFPVGSTFATNRFFYSGDYCLETEGEDVTRAEKCKFIGANTTALRGLSFCGRGRFRPENCGRCSKCVRTKIMFVASLGFVPSGVFLDDTLSQKDVRMEMSSKEGLDFAFTVDSYISAKKNGNLQALPGVEGQYKKVVNRMKAKKRANVSMKKKSLRLWPFV